MRSRWLVLSIVCVGCQAPVVSPTVTTPPPPKATALPPPVLTACPEHVDVADLLGRHKWANGSEDALREGLPITLTSSLDESGKTGTRELVVDAGHFRQTDTVAGLTSSFGVDDQGPWELSQNIGVVVRPRSGRESTSVAFQRWLWSRNYLSQSSASAVCTLEEGRPVVTLAYAALDLGDPQLAFDLATASLVRVDHRLANGRRARVEFLRWSAADARGVRWPSEIRSTSEASDPVTARLEHAEPGTACKTSSSAGPSSCFAAVAPAFSFRWPSEPKISIPFQLVAGEIVVEVRRDGEKSLAFLDSGAGITVVDGLTPAASKFVPAMVVSGTGSSQALQLGLGELSQVELGPISLVHLPAASAPIPALLAFGSKRPDIILGYSLFVGAAVRVDYAKSRVELARNVDVLRTDAMTALPLVDIGGKLVAEGSIEGVPSELELDTGNNSAFTLFKAWTDEAHTLDGHKSAAVRVSSGAGELQTDETEFRLGHGSLGPMRFDDRVASITNPPASGSVAGLAGNPLFSRCKSIVFDHAHRTLWVEPPCDRPMRKEALSGLHMRASADPAFEGLPWVVEAVVADGPAARAGLLPGDRVLSIDGKPAKGELEATQNAFIKPDGATLTLEIARGSEKKKFVLKLFRAL